MNDNELQKAINEASGKSKPKRVKTVEKAPTMFKDLDYNTFRDISAKIDEITKDINPTGSNGRMPQWVAAVNHMFAKLGIAQESYVQTWWKWNAAKPNE